MLFFVIFAVSSCVFQPYTAPEVLHRLERGTLGGRWGVCSPDLGGVLAGRGCEITAKAALRPRSCVG